MPRKKAGRPTQAERLDHVIATISRLRAQIDAMELPDGAPRRDLTMHLSLASMAAHQLRFESGESDIVLIDE